MLVLTRSPMMFASLFEEVSGLGAQVCEMPSLVCGPHDGTPRRPESALASDTVEAALTARGTLFGF